MRKVLICLAFLWLCAVATAAPITYQGQLQDGSAPYDGPPLGMEFRLFDHWSSGDIVGPQIFIADVSVSDGLFQVELDFGDVYDQPLWLEVEVDGQVLSPRQRITAAPVAVRTLNVPEGADTLADLNCSSGEIAKWDGNEWVCAPDEDTTYSSGDGLTLSGFTFSLDTEFADDRYWKIGGNEFVASNIPRLGTINNRPLEIQVDGHRVFRFQRPGFGNQEPNLVGGHESNAIVGTSVRGATIAGGGEEFDDRANTISGSWGFIGSGSGNRVDGNYGVVGGGLLNSALESGAFVGSGTLNQAAGPRSVVAGGFQNQATGNSSVVPGGSFNQAEGSNSFAAGVNARALNDRSFVWSSITSTSGFSSTGENQFLIAADGGVGVNTNSPQASLDVEGDTRIGGALSIDFSDSEDMPPPGGFESPTLYTVGSTEVESLFFGTANSADPVVSFRSARTLGAALNDIRLHRPPESGSFAQAARLIVEGQARVEDSFVVEGNTELQGRLLIDSETEDPMRLESDGQTVLLVAANGGMSVGTGLPAADNGIRTSGPVRVGQFLSGTTEVCRQTTGSLANCSSSERYKQDIQSLDQAGDLVAALRPVRYAWKTTGDEDIGLVAEEVAEILPQIVTRNDDGSIEGVQYSRIGPLLVAAFQEREAYWLAFRQDSEHRLAALEAENAELRQLAERNARLEKRLARLEAVLIDEVQMSGVP